MTGPGPNKPGEVQDLLDGPDLAGALESREFKRFLDHVPMAIAVARLGPDECIVYSNLEFARVTGQAPEALEGRPWTQLVGAEAGQDDDKALGIAIADDEDHIGTFSIPRSGEGDVLVDAWSNVICDESDTPIFRLVALAEKSERAGTGRDELERLIREKDVLLRELQHRVKNNLQMITSLIRLEARALPDKAVHHTFDRLAGRVEALALLYRSLSDDAAEGDEIDLGIYLSEIASAVMRAHAVEGIRLDLKVDTWPVSVNVALPTGLVVNELMTNSLKHAFHGREGGTITLQSLVTAEGCRVVIADDGIGLGDHVWPQPGKMGAMIVQSLRSNAKARLDVTSTPGAGTRVTITFDRADATD